MKFKKIKKQLEERKRIILILGIASFVLFVGLIFVCVRNFNLKNDLKEMNENINTLSVSAVNDFSLFVMGKVNNCEAVTLLADDKSITINDVRCK